MRLKIQDGWKGFWASRARRAAEAKRRPSPAEQRKARARLEGLIDTVKLAEKKAWVKRGEPLAFPARGTQRNAAEWDGAGELEIATETIYEVRLEDIPGRPSTASAEAKAYRDACANLRKVVADAEAAAQSHGNMTGNAVNHFVNASYESFTADYKPSKAYVSRPIPPGTKA